MMLWLLACGPADWASFEDERIAVVCERTFECYSAEELDAVGMVDVGTCEAALRMLSDEDGCDYQPARAGECLRGYRDQPCDEFTADIEPAGCDEVCAAAD
jgi:hypothetical protein